MSEVIPFWCYPQHWHLRGDERKRAKAHFTLSGLELRRALHDIDFEPGTVEHLIEGYGIDFEEGRLTERELEKLTKTALKESYIGGDVKYQGDGGVFFDLDWNEYWIEELKENGYTGENDDEIMQKYFSALCYGEIMKNSDEMDPFLYESARAHLIKLIGRED